MYLSDFYNVVRDSKWEKGKKITRVALTRRLTLGKIRYRPTSLFCSGDLPPPRRSSCPRSRSGSCASSNGARAALLCPRGFLFSWVRTKAARRPRPRPPDCRCCPVHPAAAAPEPAAPFCTRLRSRSRPATFAVPRDVQWWSFFVDSDQSELQVMVILVFLKSISCATTVFFTKLQKYGYYTI